MKLLAAEGLMYDPGLIECAEFDWFSARCLEDGPSFASHIRRQQRHSHVHSVWRVVSLVTENNLQPYSGPSVCDWPLLKHFVLAGCQRSALLGHCW